MRTVSLVLSVIALIIEVVAVVVLASINDDETFTERAPVGFVRREE